jgi:uncharacterized protein (TIGR02145 family)
MARILFLMMFPFMCFSQITPSEDIPVNNILKEKENLDTKRKASYNLDEIKVRWKKAALENCTGVPCVVTPPPPPPPSFTCGTSTVTDVDGNIYETVAIVGTGVTQCWTKTNLKVTRYNDGVTSIPDSTSAGWTTANTGARTEYIGAAGYVGTYGYLYNWYAAAGIITAGGSSTKNICPSGWHVPTDTDWTNLVKFIDPTGFMNTGTQSSTAGNKLKKNDATLWTNNIGTDDFKFSALPGGYRDNLGSMGGVRTTVIFWSGDVGMVRELPQGSGDVFRSDFNSFKTWGLSVRCLKN